MTNFRDKVNNDLLNELKSLDQNDFKNRMSIIEKILERDPNHLITIREKAELLSKMDRKEEAIECMKLYLKLVQPGFTHSSYHFIAEICFQMKHLQEALNNCNTALDISPNFIPSLNLRSKVFELLGEYSKADEDLKLIATLEAEEKLKHKDPNHYYRYK
ncbi:MAG: hypothetical protein O9264_18875 [Leptospira sp.]|jgi:tetratricopeptide (TPR) repeat protein|nr:hypothetical protein [Leptospira sp.]